MVEITINKTSKPLGNSQENYSTFDYEVKQFKSKEDAINFLKKEYQGVKRIKMYIGDGDFAGWVYCFVNSDCSHYPEEKWRQQDWVTMYEVERKLIRF